MAGILQGKHIILGISGSIAAYKSAFLARLLVKEGAEVQVVMTPSATQFITPLTMATLTERPVLIEFFDKEGGASWNSHVELGLWADLMIIAPATACTMGKMANGIADNLLITTYLSCRAPVMIAPAMDMDMYAHPSTEQSIQKLRSWEVEVVEPGRGELASRLVGQGRMAEPNEILQRIASTLRPYTPQPLEGMTVLITSGPTREPIDPVRYIGNHSSGKMGAALAQAVSQMGGRVCFVTGPTAYLPQGEQIEVVQVETAEEMLQACLDVEDSYDVAIFCAAVADYRVKHPATHKIKRETKSHLTLELVPNPDIAATLGKHKGNGQIHVGFALETDVQQEQVQAKINAKQLDLIVVNSLQDSGAGFGTDTNRVAIYNAQGEVVDAPPLMSKESVAERIVEAIVALI